MEPDRRSRHADENDPCRSHTCLVGDGQHVSIFLSGVAAIHNCCLWPRRPACGRSTHQLSASCCWNRHWCRERCRRISFRGQNRIRIDSVGCSGHVDFWSAALSPGADNVELGSTSLTPWVFRGLLCCPGERTDSAPAETRGQRRCDCRREFLVLRGHFYCGRSILYFLDEAAPNGRW